MIRASAPAANPSTSVTPLVGSALELTLQVLQPLLAIPGLTEVCINQPHQAFIETGSGWRRESLPFADFQWCLRVAKLVAHSTRQRITEESPLLSAALPSGERIQVVIPPATSPGTVAMSIRRPSPEVWRLDELAARGVFARTRRANDDLDESERELLSLAQAQQYEAFMRLAVRSRKNIVVSGATGSGKTTFTKALIQEIDGAERLITIEDAQELALPHHANCVRLFYSKDDQGQATISPKQLLECCLRLRPDRILLAELRAEEAFDFMRANASHPGSITSVHASSAELAFEQLVLLIKQSAAGAQLPRADILNLLTLLVDVVVQFGVERRERFIRDVWYDPQRKHSQAARK